MGYTTEVAELAGVDSATGKRKLLQSDSAPASARKQANEFRTTIFGWPNSRRIFGHHPGATKQELSVAEDYCKRENKIFCFDCGTTLAPNKKGWVNHRATKKCIDAAKDPRNRFNGSLLIAARAASAVERGNNLLHAPFPAQQFTLVCCCVDSTEDKKIAMLTSAALAAANISYTSQAEIFGAGSPEIAGLVRLGAMGLGGADTIAQNVKSAVRGVWEDKVLAAWDVTRAERLPVCLLADESTAKTERTEGTYECEG